MEEFTIFCTQEQTKKALELGAPVIKVDTRDKRMIYYHNMCFPKIADYPYAIPTAEQMINWLEGQTVLIQIYHEIDWLFSINHFEGVGRFSTRKEATVAAIDAALDYLTHNKNHD